MSYYLPKSLVIDTEVMAEAQRNEEAQLALAVARRNKPKLEAIRHRRGGGMSVARLEQIYGRQLVYIALKGVKE